PILKSVQCLNNMEERQIYCKPVFTTIPSQESSLQESTTSFEVQSCFLKPQETAGITKKLSGASLEIENIMSHKPEITVPEPVKERPHIHPEFMDEIEEHPAPPVPPHQGSVTKDEI
uniref:Fibrous sheath-interacting protein 1 n=1 Tax=Steinernema glaseri TaxID=37863 RepID=A0A1I8AID4_9BILA